MIEVKSAKFHIGQVVRHRLFSFRGIIFDVDPEFSNTEEWYQSIPEDDRPSREQPYYHILAENDDSEYVAYVSEQNLVADENNEPLRHANIADIFERDQSGSYQIKHRVKH